MSRHRTPTPPRSALSDSKAAVLIAAIRDPHPTVRSIQASTGVLSTSTVFARLEELRLEGLVLWEDGKRGSLRPNVGLVVAPLFFAHPNYIAVTT